MIKELYINGVLCDIDDSTELPLQYKSFLFAGIDNIPGYRSWTVSLQKTAKNLSICDQCQLADNDSSLPYVLSIVDYYINGFHVISNGKAILLRITDRIEWEFVFGTAFDKIAALGDTKLRDIAEVTGYALNESGHAANEYGDWINWNRTINDTPINGICYPIYYGYTSEDNTYAGQANDDMPFIVQHPTITFEKIIELVERNSGIAFTELKAFSEMANHIFLMRELNGYLGKHSSAYVDDEISAIVGSGTIYAPHFTEISGSAGFIVTDNNITAHRHDIIFQYDDTSNVDDVSGFVKLNCKSRSKIELGYWDTNGVIVHVDPTYETISGDYPYDYTNSDWIEFSTKLSDRPTTYHMWLNFDTSCAADWYDATAAHTLTIIASPNDAYYNRSADSYYFSKGWYPIIPNLPDMSCADFIMQCMAITCSFPYLKDGYPNEVFFRSPSIFYTNIAAGIYRDWSDRLIKTTDFKNEAEDVSFTIGDYTQRNLLDYKENTDNHITTKDYLTVNNLNLSSKEYELVRLLFAAGFPHSKTDDTIDYPIYDVHLESGVIETKYLAGSYNDIMCKLVQDNTYGSNLIYNSEFDGTGWWYNFHSTFTAAGGIGSVHSLSESGAQIPMIEGSGILVNGHTYNVSARIWHDGTNIAKIWNGYTLLYTCDSASAWYDVDFTFVADTSAIELGFNITNPTAAEYIQVDHFRVKEITFSEYHAEFTPDLYFNGTTGIKAVRYPDYQKLILRPRYLIDQLRLTPYDLQIFDQEVPIYLSQYGKFYVPMLLEVSGDLSAEVELLEIKDI